MASVSRTFHVKTPPQIVVPYLADFTHAEQWDPGTVRCVRTDEGPVRVGSSWQNTSKIAGISTELVYTLQQLTDSQIVLVGRNDTATSTERIVVTPSATGSSITYTNDLQFNGVAKLATPLAKLVFERLGDKVEQRLVEILDALQD